MKFGITEIFISDNEFIEENFLKLRSFYETIILWYILGLVIFQAKIVQFSRGLLSEITILYFNHTFKIKW